jgi:hypothetical protein
MDVRGLIGGGLKRVRLGRAFVYSSPALLCVIACAQIYVSMTRSLSPWKGGGFGMFSTVDSPDARFLRIYLINGSEETPVLVPDRLKTLAREAQTIPTRALLLELADRMAHGTWGPYRLTHPVQSYRAAQLGGDAGADAIAGLADPSGPAADYGLKFPADGGKCSPDGQLVFTKLLNMRGRGDPAPEPGEVVEFQRVRVELWKYEFEVATSRLKAAKYLEVTVDAQRSSNR